MSEPETDLWESGIFSWTAREKEVVAEFRRKLRTYGSELGKYLADVAKDSKSGIFAADDTRKLESAIIKDYGKTKAIPFLQMLEKLVWELNDKYEKSIPPPSRRKGIEPETSVFLDGNAAAHNLVHELIKADARWSNCWIGPRSTSRKSNGRPAVFSWEMVIVSAALHGGIISAESVVALVDALCEPGKYFACSKVRGYADLLLQPNDGKDVLVRRWYPDDLLLMLMSKVEPSEVKATTSFCSDDRPRERKKLIGAIILKGLKAEFRRQGLAAELLPDTFPVILKKIQQTLRSEIAATLVDFAAGYQPARSLLPSSIGRIYGDPAAPPALLDLPSADNEKPEPDNPEAYQVETDSETTETGSKTKEPDWLKAFRSFFNSLKSTDKKAVQRALATLPRRLPPVGMHLKSLLIALLTKSASSGRSWALSSIKCCVLTIGRRFGTAIGFDNPARAGPDKLLVLYRGVIEKAAESSVKSPARLQKTVAWALREYQRHIVCKFKANAVQESVAFRVEQGILPVNARVLSLDDMFRIIDYIKTAPQAHWLPKYREYAIAESVLSFFGGTRREEGLGLTASDYFPSLVGLLLIRDNEIRTLKTLNAKRALYLSITAYPFTELVEHVARSFRQPQQLDKPIFADVSDDLIIRIIHDAILKVTGDPNCTLHSLRHSFGHWMYFRLALAQLSSSEEELLPHLNETKKWLRESPTYRQLLYSNGLVENDHAWATADELGHSIPEKVTLPHYVHCQDMLLSLALKNNPVFGPETVRRLWAAEQGQKKKAGSEIPLTAPISEPTIYSVTKSINTQIHRTGADGLSSRKTAPREMFRKRFGLKRLEPENTEPSREAFEWLDATENALYLAGVLNMPLSAVGKSTGLNEETLQQILLRLKKASRMKSPKDGTILHEIAPFRGGPAAIGDSAVGCHALRPRRSVKGVNWASIFADKLKRYVESNDEQAVTTIGYVVRNMLPGRPCVVFLDPESQMVSKYLNLCRWLGILREQIMGFSCDRSQNTSPSGEWLSRWGLSRRWKSQIVNQHGRGRLLRKPDEWLILEPTSLERDQPNGHDLGRWLRYALLMAYIRFGPLIGT